GPCRTTELPRRRLSFHLALQHRDDALPPAAPELAPPRAKARVARARGRAARSLARRPPPHDGAARRFPPGRAADRLPAARRRSRSRRGGTRDPALDQDGLAQAR